jgi:ubiquinone/menaquinone biosynthesis C-methylase UbiE
MQTKEIYNKISDSWYNIRHWTLFRKELKEVGERWSGGKLLNVGCAHGADFLPFDGDEFYLYGTDISLELLKNAEEYADKFNLYFHLFASDMKDLPVKDEVFDYIICMASLHHLLKRGDRLKALDEMKRVLKTNGEILISVWNKWYPKFLFKDKIIEKPWNFKGKILRRKYYLYTYGELEKEIEESGLEILDIHPEKKYNFPIKYFSENILALAKKVT